MIDPYGEDLISIAQAAKSLPTRPSVRTVWRWIQKGCRGVKLETVAIGGRRYTSRQAIGRFIAERTTDEYRRPESSVQLSGQRQKQVDRAERDLDRAGI
jgi:hypothetical protein